MNYKEIYDRLPASWKDVKLRTAIKYLNTEMELPSDDEFENIQIGLNNTYKTISVMADVPLEELKQLPMNWINKMATKTEFMNTPPKPGNESNIRWKGLDEVSYDNFITFTQLQDDMVNNMPAIIKSFSTTKLSQEEILDMNMVEVQTCFFLLRRQLNKSTERMRISLARKLIKQVMKESWHSLTHSRRK